MPLVLGVDERSLKGTVRGKLIHDTRRSSTSEDTVRYAGLDITVYSSDDYRAAGHLARQGPGRLRWALCEAAKSGSRAASPDHVYCTQARARLRADRATLSVVRKLARKSHHILLTGHLYPGSHQISQRLALTIRRGETIMQEVNNAVAISATTVQGSRVAHRVLDVLLCFAGESGELGVSEIARRLELDKAQVHRYLSALKEKGFVTLNPKSRRYSLGLRLLQLSDPLSGQYTSRVIAHLERLRDKTGETASLASDIGGFRVHLFQVESRHDLRRTFPMGVPLPIHTGASGLCLLAFRDLSADPADGLQFPLDMYTHETICDEDTLRTTLLSIRNAGWSLTLGQRTEGLRSIAAPVWNWTNEVFSIVASGPSDRFSHDDARGCLPILLEVASDLTRELGGKTMPAKNDRNPFRR